MDHEALRFLIRQRLQAGHLPHDSITRVWSSPSGGEACDACDTFFAKAQLQMKATTMASGERPLQLHFRCFQIWAQEWRRAFLGASLAASWTARQDVASHALPVTAALPLLARESP